MGGGVHFDSPTPYGGTSDRVNERTLREGRVRTDRVGVGWKNVYRKERDTYG